MPLARDKLTLEWGESECEAKGWKALLFALFSFVHGPPSRSYALLPFLANVPPLLSSPLSRSILSLRPLQRHADTRTHARPRIPTLRASNRGVGTAHLHSPTAYTPGSLVQCTLSSGATLSLPDSASNPNAPPPPGRFEEIDAYCGRPAGRSVARSGGRSERAPPEQGGGSVMTDSGGNGIRSRVRFGARGGPWGWVDLGGRGAARRDGR